MLSHQQQQQQSSTKRFVVVTAEEYRKEILQEETNNDDANTTGSRIHQRQDFCCMKRHNVRRCCQECFTIQEGNGQYQCQQQQTRRRRLPPRHHHQQLVHPMSIIVFFLFYWTSSISSFIDAARTTTTASLNQVSTSFTVQQQQQHRQQNTVNERQKRPRINDFVVTKDLSRKNLIRTGIQIQQQQQQTTDKSSRIHLTSMSSDHSIVSSAVFDDMFDSLSKDNKNDGSSFFSTHQEVNDASPGSWTTIDKQMLIEKEAGQYDTDSTLSSSRHHRILQQEAVNATETVPYEFALPDIGMKLIILDDISGMLDYSQFEQHTIDIVTDHYKQYIKQALVEKKSSTTSSPLLSITTPSNTSTTTTTSSSTTTIAVDNSAAIPILQTDYLTKVTLSSQMLRTAIEVAESTPITNDNNSTNTTTIPEKLYFAVMTFVIRKGYVTFQVPKDIAALNPQLNIIGLRQQQQQPIRRSRRQQQQKQKQQQQQRRLMNRNLQFQQVLSSTPVAVPVPMPATAVVTPALSPITSVGTTNSTRIPPLTTTNNTSTTTTTPTTDTTLSLPDINNVTMFDPLLYNAIVKAISIEVSTSPSRSERGGFWKLAYQIHNDKMLVRTGKLQIAFDSYSVGDGNVPDATEQILLNDDDFYQYEGLSDDDSTLSTDINSTDTNTTANTTTDDKDKDDDKEDDGGGGITVMQIIIIIVVVVVGIIAIALIIAVAKHCQFVHERRKDDEEKVERKKEELKERYATRLGSAHSLLSGSISDMDNGNGIRLGGNLVLNDTTNDGSNKVPPIYDANKVPTNGANSRAKFLADNGHSNSTISTHQTMGRNGIVVVGPTATMSQHSDGSSHNGGGGGGSINSKSNNSSSGHGGRMMSALSQVQERNAASLPPLVPYKERQRILKASGGSGRRLVSNSDNDSQGSMSLQSLQRKSDQQNIEKSPNRRQLVLQQHNKSASSFSSESDATNPSMSGMLSLESGSDSSPGVTVGKTIPFNSNKHVNNSGRNKKKNGSNNGGFDGNTNFGASGMNFDLNTSNHSQQSLQSAQSTSSANGFKFMGGAVKLKPIGQNYNHSIMNNQIMDDVAKQFATVPHRLKPSDDTTGSTATQGTEALSPQQQLQELDRMLLQKNQPSYQQYHQKIVANNNNPANGSLSRQVRPSKQAQKNSNIVHLPIAEENDDEYENESNHIRTSNDDSTRSSTRTSTSNSSRNQQLTSVTDKIFIEESSQLEHHQQPNSTSTNGKNLTPGSNEENNDMNDRILVDQEQALPRSQSNNIANQFDEILSSEYGFDMNISDMKNYSIQQSFIDSNSTSKANEMNDSDDFGDYYFHEIANNDNNTYTEKEEDDYVYTSSNLQII